MEAELINIEEAIYRFPLSLNSIKNEILINQINQFLPYSTGIEIECRQSSHFKLSKFENIPDIMDVQCDSGEQRFRIPNGIKGMICLFNICKQLKLNSELNPLSGIHYHIDMTDVFHLLTKELVDKNKEWILIELDKWEDAKNTFQKRDCRINDRCYVNFQSQFKTAEIRIGTQSFDYAFIIKRIIEANQMIRKFKEIILATPNELRIKNIASQLALLTAIQHDGSIPPTQMIMQNIINNRIIKINKNGTK
jgi:hypothetical protein